MARTLEIIVSPNRTGRLLQDIEALDGVSSVQLNPGTSRRPPGDVITVLTTNSALHPLLRLLDRHGLARDPSASITLAEPAGVISVAAAEAISGDTTEIPWEEMEYAIARESNMSANAVVTMAAAGIFAAVGVATSALHLVLAAMLIAPGFDPIVRVALGVMSRSSVWKRGLKDFAAGYAALLAGAATGSLALMAMGRPLPAAEASYLHLGDLPRYWTTISGPSVMVSAVAGLAGAVLIAHNRSILTAGVMVALSLVPTIVLAAMGALTGDLPLAVTSLGRWALDVGIVFVMSLAVFAWKRRAVQQRPMMG
jgi:hypothetical protein